MPTKIIGSKKQKPHQYLVEYKHKGKAYSASIIAASMRDASSRLASMRKTVRLSGELVA